MRKLFLKNYSLRSVLMMGFITLILLIAFLGFTSIRQANRMWMDTSELYNHPYKVNIAIREIQRDIISMQRSLKDAVLAQDDLQTNKYIAEISDKKLAVENNFSLIYGLYLGNRTTIDSAYNLFMEWDPIRDTTIALKRMGKTSEAAHRTTVSTQAFIKSMMQRIDRLKEFAMTKAASFYANAEIKKDNLQSLMLVYVVVILLFIIVFFILIIRSVTVPLNEISEVAEKHRLGDYNSRSSMEASNEIGNFAKTFNRMADSIEHEMEIRSQAAAINEVFLSSNDLTVVGQNLLDVLLTATNSQVGAIYILDEKTENFEPWFTIGMTSKHVKGFSATNFEGEFGRTLLNKKIVQIKEIPEDTPYVFSIVPGAFRPREILNIPVIKDGRVLAIISLASLYSYTAGMIESIDFSLRNITIGTINLLANEKVREYSARLDKQNAILEGQSKELKLQTEELIEQNTELEMQKRQINEASRLKSEFLANMSHELRTPLNSVIALSGVLNKRLVKRVPDEEYSYLEIIERNGKLLLHLINDILDLSRIEAGKAEYRASQFAPGELVDSIIETLSHAAEEKGLRLVNAIPENLPMIYSDVTKCRHILQNLIDNAVKFTDMGIVEVSAQIMNDMLYISVTDTGIGIQAEHLDRIFDEFLQVDGSSSRKHKGTGLGLAIAKKYALMLNGKIEVKSQPGKGSVFTLSLPLQPSAERKLSSQIVKHPHKEDIERLGRNQDENLKNPKSILIVEDNEAAIIQLTEILREQGYHLAVARNGLEAIDHVQTVIPDAIILDLMMPEMNGFEVLEKIRSAPETAKIPVLILTSKYLSNDDLKQLSENNVSQLIQKGDVSKTELLDSIMTIFDGKHHSKKVVLNSGKTRARILVIEDNPDNVKTVQAILGNEHELLVATNGVAGLHLAKIKPPDLILLDISLPGMDGYAVFDEIKKIPGLKHIPVIALTAKVMKGDREHILRYGFDDYISKPVEVEFFEKTLNSFINRN